MSRHVLVLWVNDNKLSVLKERDVLDPLLLRDPERIGMVQHPGTGKAPKQGWEKFPARVLVASSKYSLQALFYEVFVMYAVNVCLLLMFVPEIPPKNASDVAPPFPNPTKMQFYRLNQCMVVYPVFGIVKQKIEFRIYETTFFKEKNIAIACLASARTTFNISTPMHDV